MSRAGSPSAGRGTAWVRTGRCGSALDLVAHAADWRGGLGWLVARYPQYFNPAVPLADEMAGCGAYTGNEDPIDAAKLRRMAFRVSWKLSDDNPWTGMFLPPWEDPDKHWERACDASAPANEPRLPASGV